MNICESRGEHAESIDMKLDEIIKLRRRHVVKFSEAEPEPLVRKRAQPGVVYPSVWLEEAEVWTVFFWVERWK